MFNVLRLTWKLKVEEKQIIDLLTLLLNVSYKNTYNIKIIIYVKNI